MNHKSPADAANELADKIAALLPPVTRGEQLCNEGVIAAAIIMILNERMDVLRPEGRVLAIVNIVAGLRNPFFRDTYEKSRPA